MVIEKQKTEENPVPAGVQAADGQVEKRVSVEKRKHATQHQKTSDGHTRRTSATQMADELARAIANTKLPQIGSMMLRNEISSSMAAAARSSMLFKMPELAITQVFGIEKLAHILPAPLPVYQSPIFESMEKLHRTSEATARLVSAQTVMPIFEYGKGIYPIGLASQIDAASVARLTGGYTSIQDIIGANPMPLGVGNQLFPIGAAALWADDAKSHLMDLSSQFENLQSIFSSLNEDAARMQQTLDAIGLSYTREIAFPFQDFRPEQIFDPELLRFFSLHNLLETSLKSLLAFALFYRANVTNVIARMFLNTIIVRLEGFLELLVVLDNSPVHTFGNLDDTTADPIATLLQIQAELPSIKRDIESSADSWRH